MRDPSATGRLGSPCTGRASRQALSGGFLDHYASPAVPFAAASPVWLRPLLDRRLPALDNSGLESRVTSG